MPLYNVERLLLLSAIQNGMLGPTASPQGFCRLASMVFALATTLVLLDTSAVSVNPTAAGGIELPPLPPPHAATARAQKPPSCADSDARLKKLRYKVIESLRKVIDWRV